MKKLFEYLFGYRNDKYSQDRLHIKDVKPGQNIYIEHQNGVDRITHVKCLSNDPYSQKMVVMINWVDESGNTTTSERLIIGYQDKCVKDFHLLNNVSVAFVDSVYDLKKKLEIALKNENYLLAEDIKKKLNDIEKK